MRKERVLVVAAHPDDETIGCGALLGWALDAWVVYLTDGAPHDAALVPAAWRGNREGYRLSRRREAVRALELAGVSSEHIVHLGGVDQEATRELVALSRRAAAVIDEVAPDLVIAHPYEGGHPDHDAAALVARSAITLVAASRGSGPRLVEMTSYHGAFGKVVTGSFLGDQSGAVRVVLSPEDRARKEDMLRCFESQQEVLAPFTVCDERFRIAPSYDFTSAPHGGLLHYERLGWAMSGQEWRRLATGALLELFGSSG